MTVILKPSPNYNQRDGNQLPRFIILHYTGMKTLTDALERLCDPVSQVSAHYTVGRDGVVFRHVDIEKRAWHAGKSSWRGIKDMNSASIGIEIENPGHEHGYQPFPMEQIQAVINLAQEIIKQYRIVPQNILAHSDVAPDRKEDPGELFPWAELAKQQVGVWPEPLEEDYARIKSWDLDKYVAAVKEYGYDTSKGYEYALRAFERHFMPEMILGTSQDENVARARLACLLRQYGGTSG